MALVTSCPHCDTSFLVVVDQLKLRSGKVRCGVCHEVFCALDRLRADEDPEGSEQLAQPEPSKPLVQSALSERPARSEQSKPFEAAGKDADHGGTGGYDAPGEERALGFGVDDYESQGFGVDDYGAEDYAPERRTGLRGAEPGEDEEPAPAEPAAPHTPIPPRALETQQARESRGGAGPVGVVDFPDSRGPYLALDELILDTPETPDFPGPGARARRSSGAAARPEHRGDEGWRTLLARHRRLQQVLAALLILGLLLQAVAGGRDWLAARFPVLEPLVAAVAAPFGLEIQLPRSLDALSIESFELRSSGAAGLLAASAILRNEARYAVRWPSMDLTLTDAGGQVLAKRIIDPVDYLEAIVNPPLRGRSERPIRFALQTDGFEPAGYSVLLFYRR
jgi:predicted Zn finger-like uncharacterized protein